MKALWFACVLTALVLAPLGCPHWNDVRPDYRPIPLCTVPVKMNYACEGKILADGVEGCFMCMKNTNKIFPTEEDMVLGCYNDAYSHYCVDASGCMDTRCREDPLWRRFRKSSPDASSPGDQAPPPPSR